MREIRIVPWTLLLLGVASCDDPIRTEQLTPSDLAGTFYLDSINGKPLPYVDGNTTFYKVLLRLNADGTVAWTVDTFFCGSAAHLCTEMEGGPNARQWLLLQHSELELVGADYVFTNNSSRATVEPNRLVFGGSAIYKRVDPAISPRAIDVRPDTFSLRVGETRNVFATTTPYVPVLSVIVRDTTIARFGSGISVTALRPGTTFVVAASGNVRDSATVTVRP